MSEVGRLGRNFAAVALTQLAFQGLTFVSSLALARTLGVEQYGIYVFALTFPSWFLLFLSLGLDEVLTINVAADKSKASSYLTAVTAVRLPILLVTIIVLWISYFFVFSDPYVRIIAMLFGLSSIMFTFSGTFATMFRAFEKLEFRAFVAITERSITTALVLLLLYFGYGLPEVSVVFVVSSALHITLSLIVLGKKFIWFSPKVDFLVVRDILKKAVPFALASVVGPLMYSSGPVLLMFLSGLTSTGHFNAAFTLVTALITPLTMYATVFLPAMSRMYGDTPGMLPMVILKSQKFFFALGLVLALGGWFYADEIMTFIYGGAFHDSARSFEILVFVLATSTAVVGIGTALAATGYQKLNLYITTTGAIVNVGLCFALIPLWGHVGAASAFLVASLLMGVLSVIAISHTVARIDLREPLARPVIAGAAMIFALSILPELPLWFGLVLALLIYFSVLVILRGITKEDWIIIKKAVRGVAKV